MRHRRLWFSGWPIMRLGSHYGRMHVQHPSTWRCHCVAGVRIELCDFIGCRRTSVHLGTIPRKPFEYDKCAIRLHKHNDANAIAIGGLETGYATINPWAVSIPNHFSCAIFFLGSLLIWDVRTGEQTREIQLDCANLHLCPKKILFACGSVICDYGNEMRIVRFPLVTDKCDWVLSRMNSRNKENDEKNRHHLHLAHAHQFSQTSLQTAQIRQLFSFNHARIEQPKKKIAFHLHLFTFYWSIFCCFVCFSQIHLLDLNFGFRLHNAENKC